MRMFSAVADNILAQANCDKSVCLCVHFYDHDLANTNLNSKIQRNRNVNNWDQGKRIIILYNMRGL